MLHCRVRGLTICSTAGLGGPPYAPGMGPPLLGAGLRPVYKVTSLSTR